MRQKNRKIHLRLAFRCKGGGGRVVEKSKKSTSGSRLDVREVVLVGDLSNSPKSPPLAHV